MAMKAVNDTMGPDGLVPTLLVYGAYPRMSDLDPLTPSMTQRTKAIQQSIEEIAKIRARLLEALLWGKWGLFEPQGIQVLKSSFVWCDGVVRRGVLRLCCDSVARREVLGL